MTNYILVCGYTLNTGTSKYMLENTEGAIKNGQSRDTLNVGHRTEEEVKQNKNTQHKMCWTPLLTNTNNI